MPVIFHMCYVSDAEDKMVSQTFFLPSRSFSRAINGLEIQYLHSHLRAGLNLQPTPRTTGFTGTKPAEMVPASVLPPPQSFNESSAFCNKCCLLSILIPAPCSCSHIPFLLSHLSICYVHGVLQLYPRSVCASSTQPEFPNSLKAGTFAF